MILPENRLPLFRIMRLSPCGGTGRRARLKIVFRKEWGFDSLHGHQPSSPMLIAPDSYSIRRSEVFAVLNPARDSSWRDALENLRSRFDREEKRNQRSHQREQPEHHKHRIDAPERQNQSDDRCADY